MVGVALSRVRSIERLQILDLQPSACKSPEDAVDTFLELEGDVVRGDPNRCCRAEPHQDEEDDLENWVIIHCYM